METRNRFSALLSYLMNTAEIKNYTLAQELQYDVSYISKWLSGKVIPAEKTEVQVLNGIASCITQHGSSTGLDKLMQDYQVRLPHDLKLAVYDNLCAEYDYTRDSLKEEETQQPTLHFFPQLSLEEFLKKMRHPVLRRVRSLKVAAIMDLLSMKHDLRIEMIKLGNDQSVFGMFFPEVHFDLVICLHENEWEVVYDSIFLVNVLTMISNVDFNLYGTREAQGKVMLAVENDFAIYGTLKNPETCMATVTTEVKQDTYILYHYAKELCSRENLLVRKTTMENILANNEYFRSLLSPNPKWLIGHMTEHFMPTDLFEEVAEDLKDYPDTRISLDQLRQLHQTTLNVLRMSPIRLMFDEAAFSEFAVCGKLDFFNHRVTLRIDQRLRFMQHLLELIEDENSQLDSRLVYGNLVSDSQYLVNQNMLLADTFSYLRLDSQSGRYAMVVINQPELLHLFCSFFESVWSDNLEVMLKNNQEVASYIRHTIQGIQLLAYTQPHTQKKSV